MKVINLFLRRAKCLPRLQTTVQATDQTLCFHKYSPARRFLSTTPRKQSPKMNLRYNSGVGSTTKVLIIGGSYGGLSAAVNLLDLCAGKTARSGREETPLEPTQPILSPVDIAIVDERDGYCKISPQHCCLLRITTDSRVGRSCDWLPAGVGICNVFP